MLFLMIVSLRTLPVLCAAAKPGGLPRIEDVGGFTVVDRSGSGAVKLSGMTYAGGNTYYAVGGETAKVFTLTINVDPDSGAIREAGILPKALQLNDEAGQPVTDSDPEGVALADTHIYVADEAGPRVSRHDLATGNRAGTTSLEHPQLAVFKHAIANMSWESLTRQADGSALWTANEEALGVDGELATEQRGTVVRLQKLDADLNPVGQWAYLTDPIQGVSGSYYDRAGVVDLVALDDGRLLVLERSVGKGFRVQIFLVDFAGATDVSAPPCAGGLREQPYKPVAKTRLWARDFTSREEVNSYFVGATLGPALNDGSRSLILIADNGGLLNFMVPNNAHRLHALKIFP